MSLFLAIVLFALTLTFVAYPLLVPRRGSRVKSSDDSRLQELLSVKEATLSAIRELEFDYNLGNLAEGDYREMRRRYEQRAAAVFKTLDDLEQGMDEEIEKEVKALRQTRPAPPKGKGGA